MQNSTFLSDYTEKENEQINLFESHFGEMDGEDIGIILSLGEEDIRNFFEEDN